MVIYENTTLVLTEQSTFSVEVSENVINDNNDEYFIIILHYSITSFVLLMIIYYVYLMSYDWCIQKYNEYLENNYKKKKEYAYQQTI